jgi:MFS family permease
LHLSLLSELAGLKKAGAATGVTLMICYIGMMLISPLFGFVTDVTGSYSWAWVVLAVLSLISAGFIYAVKEKPRGA